ncbi:hypothetical protein D1BOALGB6SA_1157 [Olavius sp. associated proteobacterium Delta 1]|nr:hypothetical protein D1BOALGB6SA_1157 [Olavius sp. associated proteobacterium Delta 1]
MGYLRYFVTIEDFRLKIEYLSPPQADFDFKNDGAKRFPQFFNLQFRLVRV